MPAGGAAAVQCCPSDVVQKATGVGLHTAPSPWGGTQTVSPETPTPTRRPPTGRTFRRLDQPVAGTSSIVRIQVRQSGDHHVAAWMRPLEFWN